MPSLEKYQFLLIAQKISAENLPLKKKSQHFFTDFGTEDLSISIKEIEDLALKGKFVFFFDNFETASAKELEKNQKNLQKNSPKIDLSILQLKLLTLRILTVRLIFWTRK